MDDLLHNTPDVAVALREVEGTELGRRLVVVGVRLELESKEFGIGVLRETQAKLRRTMAWERLCARITLPIVYLRRKRKQGVRSREG